MRIVTATALTLALALAACGDDDGDDSGSAAAPEGTFVGAVEGSDAYVAVLSDGTDAFGYLCDGKKVSTWFDRTPVEDGEAELVSRDGEPIGEVTLDSDGASGEIEIDGAALAFSAEPAKGEAGLYRETSGAFGEPGSSETGWIVLADGSVRGAETKFTELGVGFIVQLAPPRTAAATEVTPGFTIPDVDF